jgi:hypothetical protein
MSYIFTENTISNTITWSQYRSLINELLEKGLVTGPKQSESLLAYTRMNVVRMNRLEKKTQLTTDLLSAIQSVKYPVLIIAITEGWCGDAAQILPVMHEIAMQNDNLSFKLLLRDQNIDIMDYYLTNGARSIPKIIFLDGLNLNELFVWGPRPAPAAALFSSLREAGEKPDTVSEELQRWYARDKSVNLMSEFQTIFSEIGKILDQILVNENQ